MHSLYFGMVAVVDDAGSPVIGARVEVEGVKLKGESALTDMNGYAQVTKFSAIVVDDWSAGESSITASKSGYETGRTALPADWPLLVRMRRQEAQ